MNHRWMLPLLCAPLLALGAAGQARADDRHSNRDRINWRQERIEWRHDAAHARLGAEHERWHRRADQRLDQFFRRPRTREERLRFIRQLEREHEALHRRLDQRHDREHERLVRRQQQARNRFDRDDRDGRRDRYDRDGRNDRNRNVPRYSDAWRDRLNRR